MAYNQNQNPEKLVMTIALPLPHEGMQSDIAHLAKSRSTSIGQLFYDLLIERFGSQLSRIEAARHDTLQSE